MAAAQGLRSLLRAGNRCLALSLPLRLAPPPMPVARLLIIAGLARHFIIADGIASQVSQRPGQHLS